jgi:hypothetical protein
MATTTDYELIINKDMTSMKRGLHNAQIKVSNFLEAYAKSHHRYQNRTGNLKRSTTFDVAGEYIKGYLTNAPYGKFIIEGFKTWEPDDFLREAIENNLDKIDAMIEQEINKELGI